MLHHMVWVWSPAVPLFRDFRYSEIPGLSDRVKGGIKCNMRISYKGKWERLKRSVGGWGGAAVCGFKGLLFLLQFFSLQTFLE